MVVDALAAPVSVIVTPGNRIPDGPVALHWPTVPEMEKVPTVAVAVAVAVGVGLGQPNV